jgi:hypothetical protein
VDVANVGERLDAMANTFKNVHGKTTERRFACHEELATLAKECWAIVEALVDKRRQVGHYDRRL